MTAFLLPQLLTAAADRDPDRPAVVDARTRLSYGELERRSNQVAHVLAEAGVRRGDRVGLFLTKSVDAIAGIYGIMKAGAAYVPLDPFAPAPRLGYIARDCEIRHLVTGGEMGRAWHALVASGAPLDAVCILNGAGAESAIPDGVRQITAADVASAPAALPPTAAISQDLAYILYTSGSTGQPKGVMLSHLNALTFVTWCDRFFRPTPDDVFSNHAPLHFDLTILDIYTCAAAGASLIVVPPDVSVFPVALASFIERHGITVWYSVPSILTLLHLHGGLVPGRLSSVRHVIFAGEVFPTKHLRGLMRTLPQARFTNLYGPTETNVCTYYPVPPLDDDQREPIPIGHPIEDVDVFAADEAGRPVPQGEVGELIVRGGTVAYGYWGDQARTARSFVTNPIGPTPDRAYRTGDLVRQRPDGAYVFLGRRDHQIKSRGYRIELGDIETALYAHPDVTECAVIPIPDEVVGNRIKAFVAVRRPLSELDLSTFCAGRLPKYMIPETFTVLPALPKTSTGKVDRTALARAGQPAPVA